MSRPVTIFTGQWADLPIETMCQKAKQFGYDGLELCTWGDHMEINKANQAYCDQRIELLSKYDLKLVITSYSIHYTKLYDAAAATASRDAAPSSVVAPRRAALSAGAGRVLTMSYVVAGVAGIAFFVMSVALLGVWPHRVLARQTTLMAPPNPLGLDAAEERGRTIFV